MTILDISEANGAIDWNAVRGHIDGAILRAGYRGYGSAGRLVADARWEANAAGCAAAGIPFGAYWVSQAIDETEAVNEAQFLDRLLHGKKISLPVFLDSEWGEAQSGSGRADRISPAQRTKNALAFLRELRRLGYRTGLYTGLSWFREQLSGEAIRADGHFIWLASVEHVEPSIPYDGWQYTWQGRVPGVRTAVDLSRFREAAAVNDTGSDWSAEARAWAIRSGIFRGDGSGDYRWREPVTREELAAVLQRALG